MTPHRFQFHAPRASSHVVFVPSVSSEQRQWFPAGLLRSRAVVTNLPFFVPDGVEVGHFQIHYANGQERAIPVIYGEDVRDAWNWDQSRAVKRGRIVYDAGMGKWRD